MSNSHVLSVLTFVLGIVALAVVSLYIFTLYKCLKLINPKNRAIKPWTVWLLLIPFFGLLWNFFVIVQTAKSLHAENRERNLQMNKINEGRMVGIAYAGITAVCTFLPIKEQEIPLILASIFWIGYWIVLRQQIKVLQSPPPQIQA